MKRYNVSLPKKYSKDGVEKTAWNTVGKLVYFPANEDKEEGFVLELHMFPDTKFFVFEDKPRDVQKNSDIALPQEEINPDDVPF